MNHYSKRDYYEALANDFRGQAALLKCIASVHLESDADEYFWNNIIQNKSVGKVNYIYYSNNFDKNKPNCKGKLTSGCEQCLKFIGFLSKDFFICIDSDYCYLLQEPNLDAQHFVAQTYTYSWESHSCEMNRLQNAYNNTNPNKPFNFIHFLTMYSETVYEPLLFTLFMERNNMPGFSGSQFYQLISEQYKSGDENNDGASIIERLKNKLSVIETIKTNKGFDFQREKTFYAALGIDVNNAYLHVRGHNLYNLINSIGKKLYYAPKSSFEKTVLKSNNSFTNNWEIQKIESDINYIL